MSLGGGDTLKHIRIRIIDLLDQHKGSFDTCKGCSICSEINHLRNQLNRDSEVKFKHILDKGQDMKKSEIALLVENDIPIKTIQKAIGIPQQEFVQMMKSYGFMKSYPTKGRRQDMTTLSLDVYQDLKAQGKSDLAIANHFGVKPHILNYNKKKWFGSDSKTVKEEKVLTPEDKTSEYEQTLKTLQFRIESFKNELAERNDYILELQTKVHELESVHAACDDVESEVESLREELEKERQANKAPLEVERIAKENAALKELLRLYL